MSEAREFSRPTSVADIGPEGVERSVAATEAERSALAERFELISLDRLQADLSLMREEDTGAIIVAGRLDAAATQRCVVSLEPVPVTLDERLETLFCAPDAIAALEETAPEEDIEIDVIENGTIDLGEWLAQSFAVLLDPYPRAEGAGLPSGEQRFGAEIEESEEDRPFAALRRLK